MSYIQRGHQYLCPRGDSAQNDTILNPKDHLFASELLWSTKTIDDLNRLKKFFKLPKLCKFS